MQAQRKKVINEATKPQKKEYVICHFSLTDYLQFRRFSFSCASQILRTAHKPARIAFLHTLNDKIAGPCKCVFIKAALT